MNVGTSLAYRVMTRVCAGFAAAVTLAACSTSTPSAKSPTPNSETVTDSPSQVRFVLPKDAPRCGVEIAQDGSVGPVLCDDGRVNAAVLKAMLERSPRLFGLPPGVDWATTEAALCRDYVDAGTIPITSDAYTYRYTADGWSTASGFPTPGDFTTRLMDGTYCQ